MEKGVFHAFGLFWKRDEINWKPGAGTRDSFRLLGRRGENLPGLQLADFRKQNGIYILYGNYGPYYVGLARARGIGKRLKDHNFDAHADKWDRFSWFTFGKVLKERNEHGLQKLKGLPGNQTASISNLIGDVEALLIKAMALENVAQMKFTNAQEWKQVEGDKVEHYTSKRNK